jgi:hypothetical protein
MTGSGPTDPDNLYNEADISCEEDLKDWFVKYCNDAGWSTETEVVREDIDKDYRCDVILHKDEFGWFGVELKYGGMGGAIDQVTEKYKGGTFLGRDITAWAILAYNPAYETNPMELKREIATQTDWDEYKDKMGRYSRMMRKRAEGRVYRRWARSEDLGYIALESARSYLEMEFPGVGTVPVGKPDIQNASKVELEMYERTLERLNPDELHSELVAAQQVDEGVDGDSFLSSF